MREQLSAVTQKWQGLTGQLDQRDGLIDQAVVKTGQFQGLLRSLSQTVGQLESQLGDHQGHSAQPDAVRKQLEEVHGISGQLREERKKLKEAEVINGELAAMVTEDYLKADLARQLESVNKPFKQLEEKAGSAFNSMQLSNVAKLRQEMPFVLTQAGVFVLYIWMKELVCSLFDSLIAAFYVLQPNGSSSSTPPLPARSSSIRPPKTSSRG